MGCDLQSDPDCAAYEQLMSKLIFDPNNFLHIPDKVNKKIALPDYQAIEKNFKQLKEDNRLEPLINSLESAYMRCTYSHGQHTSRSNTCHTPGHSGMYDHLIYNTKRLRVLELLEIPEES